MSVAESNWAGSYSYRAPVLRPGSVAEVQELVAAHGRVRALGSRHSFTDLADGDGVLLDLTEVPPDVELDLGSATVTVGGGATFHALTEALQREGCALATMASLPHISVAGAVATGTHGSGRQVQGLAGLVAGLEVVRADGELVRVRRGDADFAGSVVALGALGVVTRVTLDLVRTFDLRQEVWLDLPWSEATADLDAVLGSGYSVSLFTDWSGSDIGQVWVKRLADAPAPDLAPARRAETTVHMIPGASSAAVTAQLDVVGPWHERLPHFRADATPSNGAELQSEYFVPAARALEAVEGLRACAELLAPVLLVSEVRTVAADDLWLSGAYAADVVAFHFTWRRDWEAVHAVLPELERLLLPLGARPHWGKCSTAGREDRAAAYPMLGRFRELRDRVDPDRTFDNAFLRRFL